MTRWFMDTEFDENGSTIKLISIGLVSQNTGFYACLSDGWREDDCNDWVKANVLPKLPPRTAVTQWKTRAEVAKALEYLLLRDGTPEIWAYYADYDWVAFCQLFGRMVDLPKGMPMYCRDLKQLMDSVGVVREQLPANESEHNAFADARWCREAWLCVNRLRETQVLVKG